MSEFNKRPAMRQHSKGIHSELGDERMAKAILHYP